MGKSPHRGDQLSVYPRIVPVGDSAILIELGSEIDPEINSQIYFPVAAIERSQLAAIVELIPAYRSLLVNYDPLVSRYGEMVALLDELVAGNAASEVDTGTATIIELPVVYGGEDGPDLDTVADNAGLSIRDVIEIHSGVDYRVYMIGFAPGFPYLGGLDERIATPRLKTPRISVPAGSVGIAESQTGVYPNASPGGWQLIGRTARQLFDVASESPSLITPGSLVRFVPVDAHA